jgi:D-xylose transport system permease protein
MRVSTAAPPEAQAAAVPGDGLLAAAGAYLDKLKAGDVGSLPVIVALAAMTVFFTAKSSVFFTAINFDNLLVQMAGTAVMAIGVVFVLLLGEIDLSIGSVSGVGGVVVAELQQVGTSHNVGGIGAILLALVAGTVIGLVQGCFVAFIGVPSFVVTLAGLLAFEGVIIKLLGTEGVIGIQNNTVNNVANYFLPKDWGWGIAAAVAVALVATEVGRFMTRRRAGLPTANPMLVVLRVVAIAGVTLGVVAICNHSRGIPFAGLLVVFLIVFWTYIARRTTFGRHVYAVGGNAEAARRAGINVPRIRILVFMISGAMAALGGVIFASRLSSVDLTAGTGTILLDAISAAVIGGTSLFGGRGYVRSALLGALVIKTIENGLDLLGQTDWVKDVTTGIILLAAVTLDTVSKRRLAAAGR